MRCPNCNALVGEDELFCGECGTRIVRPAQPPAVEPEKKAGGTTKTLLAVVAIIVILVLACLCLVIGVVALGVCTPELEPTPTSAPTPVVQATRTPTRQPATVTPRPPTPTFRPPATVTPKPTATARTGGVFRENFDAATGDWSVGTGARGKRYIQDGELHIEVSEVNSIVWCSHNRKDWKDMTLEVDARQVAGPDDNDYGVLFRYQDTNNFYRFVITGEGRYRVSKYIKAQWTAIIDWQTAPAINKGAATNHLQVVCRGNTFDLYVNGEKLNTFKDDDLDQGAIAMVAGSYEQGDVHIAFDNVVVRAGNVALYDDFIDNRNQWPERTGISFLDAERGEYHIYDQNAAHAFWSTQAGRFGDFTVETQIRKVEGADDMAYGVAFRVQDISNFYNFVLTGDGRYALGKRKAGQWEFVILPKNSDAVRKGNETNVLRVVCHGSSFELYINGQYVDSAQDDFLSEGYVGFHADEDVHLAADSITIWQE